MQPRLAFCYFAIAYNLHSRSLCNCLVMLCQNKSKILLISHIDMYNQKCKVQIPQE